MSWFAKSIKRKRERKTETKVAMLMGEKQNS